MEVVVKVKTRLTGDVMPYLLERKILKYLNKYDKETIKLGNRIYRIETLKDNLIKKSFIELKKIENKLWDEKIKN